MMVGIVLQARDPPLHGILQSLDPKRQRLEDMFAYFQDDLAPEVCWIESFGGFPLRRCRALTDRRRIKVGSSPFTGEIHDGVTTPEALQNDTAIGVQSMSKIVLLSRI